MFRLLADLTFQRLCIERITLDEANCMVAGLRRAAQGLFPGKGHVFDLVIAPRLERVIVERFYPRN